MSEIAYPYPGAEPAEDEPHVELEFEDPIPGSKDELLSLAQLSFEHLPEATGVLIRKQAFPVRLRLNGGLRLEGNMFLGRMPDQTAEQALLDFLREVGNGFFPLQEPGGSTSILRAKAVQCFTVPLEGAEASAAARHRVRIELEQSELEGSVHLDIDTIEPRVSDLLNVLQTYVSLQTESEVILVQRDSIVRVQDLGRVER